MFSVLILAAALWGLTFEMVEDSVVDLIYARIFGWPTFLRAFLLGSAVVLPLSAAFVLGAPQLFQSYLPLVQKGGALLLVVIGIGWLGFAAAGGASEVEAAKEAARKPRGRARSLALATQLVAVEALEIVAILIPLVTASHPLEAFTAGILGVSIALIVAATLRRRIAGLLEGRFRTLKALSGTALILVGLASIRLMKAPRDQLSFSARPLE
jgi:uncharacterized membrane protein